MPVHGAHTGGLARPGYMPPWGSAPRPAAQHAQQASSRPPQRAARPSMRSAHRPSVSQHQPRRRGCDRPSRLQPGAWPPPQGGESQAGAWWDPCPWRGPPGDAVGPEWGPWPAHDAAGDAAAAAARASGLARAPPAAPQAAGRRARAGPIGSGVPGRPACGAGAEGAVFCRSYSLQGQSSDDYEGDALSPLSATLRFVGLTVTIITNASQSSVREACSAARPSILPRRSLVPGGRTIRMGRPL